MILAHAVRDQRPGLGAAAAAVTALAAGVMTVYPAADRLVFALIVCSVLVLAVTRVPPAAVAATMILLPFLGVARRLLIAPSGWASFDPLLVVAPVIAVVLLIRAAFERRLSFSDCSARLGVALLVVVLLQVPNPSEPLSAGVLGLMFLGAPLLWLFVGRAYMTDRLALLLVRSLVAIAMVIAIYGLLQTTTGLPPWDNNWLKVTGYSALNVGGQIRAFGTFASSAEYSVYIGAALVVTIVLALRRNVVWLLPLPLLATALFLESVRGTLVLCVFAVVVTLALSSGKISRALTVIAIALALIIGTYSVFGSTAQGIARTSSGLVSHQFAGLADPLNPDQSSLLGHLGLVGSGIAQGIAHPLGLGTGSTSLAGEKGGTAVSGTEVDISNAFVALGVVGGLLFVSLVLTTVIRFGRLSLHTRDATMLATMGILVVSLGQWLNGGYYAVTPLLWLLVGWGSMQGAGMRSGSETGADGIPRRRIERGRRPTTSGASRPVAG